MPGHHFQIALANEDASLPRFRQMRALGGISHDVILGLGSVPLGVMESEVERSIERTR